MMKSILLFVNSISKEMACEIREFEKLENRKFNILVIRDKKKSDWTGKIDTRGVSKVLTCNFDKSYEIKKTLAPYQNSLVAIISKGEVNVKSLKNIIPHVPYVYTPTESSILWATDKLSMREQLKAYDPNITPKFTVVSDDSKESIIKIIKKVGFPLVIKPTELAMSLLVSVCYHEEELVKTLKKVFRKIRKVYKENGRIEEPKVLVEEFMDGKMYSIDAYVDSKGKIYWCPFVSVKTGKEIGFDDFFGYQRITPTTLKVSTQEKAKQVAAQSVCGLGLRSTTTHIELMRTDDGWKVVELGARIGGFRTIMYKLSFDIDHAINDIRIRMNERPIISKKRKGYTAVLKFFAKKEGLLSVLRGTKKVRNLSSFKSAKIHIKVGELCLYSKHGGKGVCDIVLFHKDRSNLLADIRRVEDYIKIETVKSRSRLKY
jgi:hypothetical protein